jgi:hypothetical protein
MRCPVHHANDHVSAPLPPIAYESEPGAASRPLPPGYRRREPEKTTVSLGISHRKSLILNDNGD